jgi:hypothetical protein
VAAAFWTIARICYTREMNETKAETSPRHESPFQGLFWPVLCILGGLAVYFLMFRILVDPMNPDAGQLRNATFQFLWETDPLPSAAQVLALDLNARYAMAVPSVLMTLSFAAAMILAFVVVLPRHGRLALGLGAVGVPVGATIGLLEQYNNPIRGTVANCDPEWGLDICPLDQAVARAGELGTLDIAALGQIKLLTHWNSALSVAAIFVLGFCFVFLARRAGPDDLTPGLLLQRRRLLNATLVIGGLILVFSVATAHAFHHFAPALMVSEDAEAYRGLASAGATYWGAVYTTVMIVIAAPALASIQIDIQRAAEKYKKGANFAERQEWRTKHGLSFKLRETIAPVVASLSPVLTAPALNWLHPFLTGN